MIKKILFIVPSLKKGGMETQLMRLLENIDLHEYSITVAMYRGEVEYDVPSNVKFVDLQKTGRVDLMFYYRLFKTIKNGGYDLIDSRTVRINDQIMFIAGILKVQNLLLEVRSSGKESLKYYKRMNYCFKLFKSKWPVVCNSKKAMKEIKKIIPDYVVIKYVPNGIKVSSNMENVKIIDKKNIVIGCVGRIVPSKNLELLLLSVNKLLTELPSTTEIIVRLVGGVINVDYYSKLQRMVEKLGLQKIVKFEGDVENNQVEKYYNEMDIFVLPSNYEGTSNVLLEAMSLSKVCLISESANSDTIINEKYTFTSYEELTEKILMLLNMNEKELLEVGRGNRKIVHKYYSVGQLGEMYTRIWTDIMH